MGPDSARLVAEIYAAAWWVRHYRAARTDAMRKQRQDAIQRLGVTVREAFQTSDDFEALLAAVAGWIVQEQRHADLKQSREVIDKGNHVM